MGIYRAELQENNNNKKISKTKNGKETERRGYRI